MYSRNTLFSAKELQKLVGCSAACVYDVDCKGQAVLPRPIENMKSAIHGSVTYDQNKFDDRFSGFILGHKIGRCHGEYTAVENYVFFVHFNFETKFYVFRPQVGCTLLGTVIKKGVDNIVCLVHKCFRVAIPRPTEETDEWLWMSVNLGDQVTFRVEVCDFIGIPPYFQGKLISSHEDEEDGSETQKKKRRKGEQSSESAECGLLANTGEQEKEE